jgi:REP-associated tyrosine transposase
MHRPRPTRLKDFTYIGKHHYSLRFSTHGRGRAFEEPELAKAAIEQIQLTCAIQMFLVIAYCVMPDHVHVIVRGTSETSDLRHCVKLTKQRIEYVARSQFSTRHLWQDGYYERVLRSRHAVETAVRYVLENPVRAGLARTIDEYPFSGALLSF